MALDNRDFIAYLNTLHNVNANNSNAYAETNTTNPFFRKTMVERPVGQRLLRFLENSAPHMLILTGHAGDGKTGLLYQILQPETMEPVGKATMRNGAECVYVKDFSELDALKRRDLLETCRNELQQGRHVFLVANTGPLINAFGEMSSEQARQLVGAIDDNKGDIQLYGQTPIAVVNVATLDNSQFVKPFLRNLLAEEMWRGCDMCAKKSYCPILRNRCLARDFFERTTDFIEKRYIWQQEHGKKLTIRQIVAHLSYSLTGGLECGTVRDIPGKRFQYLFSNLFFGYQGVRIDRKASAIKAIGDILSEGHDRKRLRADEKLFIQGDFSAFPDEIRTSLQAEGDKEGYSERWQWAVRRAHMLFSADADEKSRRELMEDVFSYWFLRYLSLTADEDKPKSADHELLQAALQMIFTGTVNGGDKILITMNRDGGMTQNVQLVYDTIFRKKVKLRQKPISDFSASSRYGLYLEMEGKALPARISLPLLNYFEDIRKGIISTDIDPQLSQGIDSLRAQIIARCEVDDSTVSLAAMRRKGWEELSATLEATPEGDRWIVE